MSRPFGLDFCYLSSYLAEGRSPWAWKSHSRFITQIIDTGRIPPLVDSSREAITGNSLSYLVIGKERHIIGRRPQCSLEGASAIILNHDSHRFLLYL